MLKFGWILIWLSKNFFKLIILFFFLIFLFFLLSILIPVFSFLNAFFDIFNEIRILFLDAEKYIDEFKWEKIEPQKDEDNNTV